MAIPIVCPKCGKVRQVPDDLAGKRVKCKCGEVFRVRSAVPPPPPELSSSSPSSQLDALLNEALPPAEDGLSPLGGQAGPLPGGLGPPPLAFGGRKSKSNTPLLVGLIGGAVVLVVLGLIVLLSSGGGSSGTVADAAVVQGAATPEEAFEVLTKSQMEKNWRANFAIHTPESQTRLVGGAAFLSAMSSQVSGSQDRALAVLRKYGVDPEALKPPTTLPLGDMQAFVKQMEQKQLAVAATVRDKAGFFAEAMAITDEAGSQAMEKVPGMTADVRGKIAEAKEQARLSLSTAKLSDVRIDGDKAQGTKTMTSSGRTETMPVHFRKIDGKWYIHQPPFSEMAKMGEHPGQPTSSPPANAKTAAPAPGGQAAQPAAKP
jgi:hypothetical protein